MWIICAGISVVLCVIAWVLKVKRSEKTTWASVGSLSFVAIELLLQYRMVLDWVNKEDWSALLDVMPSAFSVLSGYVIIMIIVNIWIIGYCGNYKNQCL